MTDPLALTLTREQALDWLRKGKLSSSVVRGRLLTAAEAEEELGVRKGTVKSWAHRGFIESATIGRMVLYWSHDLYECANIYEEQVQDKQEAARGERGRFARRMPRIA